MNPCIAIWTAGSFQQPMRAAPGSASIVEAIGKNLRRELGRQISQIVRIKAAFEIDISRPKHRHGEDIAPVAQINGDQARLVAIRGFDFQTNGERIVGQLFFRLSQRTMDLQAR